MNGLKIQWGKKPSNTKHITFTTLFSTACVYFNFIANRSGATDRGWHYYYNLTRSDVYVISESESALWVAIGY